MPASLDSAPPLRQEVQPGVWLDSRLALWFAARQLLVIADLHWGYAASHRARGNLVPWWGDDDIERQLDALVADYQPAEMLWLGDVVHAAEGAARAEAYLKRSPVPVTLVAGNHDRRWRSAGNLSVTRGEYFFHHGDAFTLVPPNHVEVIGHHHPAVSWGDHAGTRLRIPAFVAGARRWILPAFSPWSTGTPWRPADESDQVIWAVAPTRIFALPRRRSPDPVTGGAPVSLSPPVR